MKKYLIVLGATCLLSIFGMGITETNAMECMSFQYECEGAEGGGFMGSCCGENRQELQDIFNEMVEINCGS